MMAYPRVPPSQIRPPIPPIPTMSAQPVFPMRSARNRFSQPFNPMMPVAFNRQSKQESQQLQQVKLIVFFFLFSLKINHGIHYYFTIHLNGGMVLIVVVLNSTFQMSPHRAHNGIICRTDKCLVASHMVPIRMGQIVAMHQVVIQISIRSMVI